MVFAVSVTTKRTSTPSRFRLPGTTMPPMRNVRPTGASFAATCEGVKKNTRFLLNAVSTSAVAMPSAATPAAIQAIRLCLGFTFPLHQHDDLDRKQGKGDAIRTPDVKPVAAHVEELADPSYALPAATPVTATAVLYDQKEPVQSAMKVKSAPVGAMARAMRNESRVLNARPMAAHNAMTT